MYFEEEKKEILFINAYQIIHHLDTDLESVCLGTKAMVLLSEMNFPPAKEYLSYYRHM